VSAVPVEDLTPAEQPSDFEMREVVYGATAFIAGAANVALQLGVPGVGRGVYERPLPGRDLRSAPLSRALHTLSYLSVATFGSDEDRVHLRRMVTKAHAHVRSGPESPVSYSAYDHDLQLWVAACLYYGWTDTLIRLKGPMDEARAEAFYQAASRLGTTLQMPADIWPETRAEFDAWFAGQLDQLTYDPEVRGYLRSLMRGSDAPLLIRPAAMLLGRLNIGFLPESVRAKLGLRWTRVDAMALWATLSSLRLVYAVAPAPMRVFPFNLLLWDFRRRVRRSAARIRA